MMSMFKSILKSILLLLLLQTSIYSIYIRVEGGVGYGGYYFADALSDPTTKREVHYLGLDIRLLIGTTTANFNRSHSFGALFGLFIPWLNPNEQTETVNGNPSLVALNTQSIIFSMPVGLGYDYTYKRFLLHFQISGATFNLTYFINPTAPLNTINLAASASLGFGLLVTNSFTITLTYTAIANYYTINIANITSSALYKTVEIHNLITLGFGFRFGSGRTVGGLKGKNQQSLADQYRKKDPASRGYQGNYQQQNRGRGRGQSIYNPEVARNSQENKEQYDKIKNLENQVNNMREEKAERERLAVEQRRYAIESEEDFLLQQAREKMRKIQNDLKNLNQ